jgi:hypothetical protein
MVRTTYSNAAIRVSRCLLATHTPAAEECGLQSRALDQHLTGMLFAASNLLHPPVGGIVLACGSLAVHSLACQ